MNKAAAALGYNPGDEFGNLPDFEAEVRAAASALTKTKPTLLIGPAATETKVKESCFASLDKFIWLCMLSLTRTRTAAPWWYLLILRRPRTGSSRPLRFCG